MNREEQVSRAAEDIRDAWGWFREQEMSTSAVDALEDRCLSIVDRLAPPKVVPISSAWGFDRREGWSVRVASPQRDKKGAT